MWFLSSQASTKTAIKLGEEELSFIELRQKIEDIAAQLKKLPKAVLLLNASFHFDFLIQFLAAIHIHKPVALFAAQWSEQEQQEKLAILGDCMRINDQAELIEFHDNKSVHYHPELALILFTSGSTGQVKAVQLSEKNIKANCLAVIKALEFSNIQSQLIFLPLSYSFGLLGQLLPGLMSGISTELIGQFIDIKTILEKGQVPHMWSGVPSHWVAINRMAFLYPESAARIAAIVSAGAPLSTSLRAELHAHFPNAVIYNNYGLTEASPRVLTYSSKDPLFMEDYAGYPVGDWQLKLSADQELFIQGSQLMLGYLGNEDHEKIQDGWMATGDLAEILPSGLVAIKGRRDNQVNVAGEKVNLTELEHRICLIDAIKEVIVLPMEDEVYGVRLLACLEKNPLLASTSEQQLAEQIQRHLLPKKLPITVRYVEKMPRNQHGKLDRKSLSTTLNPKENESC